jgi:hypothetical protein
MGAPEAEVGYGNRKHNFLFGAAHAADLAHKCTADEIQPAA